MSPQMTAAATDIAIDMLIGVSTGVFFLLLQNRTVGKKPGTNAKFDAWHAKWSPKLRVIAYLCFASSVGIAAIKLPQLFFHSGETGEPYVASNDGLIEQKVPTGWQHNKKTPFNLQLISGASQLSSGAFVLQRQAFDPAVFNPEVLLNQQIDELKSKRDKVINLEPRVTITRDGKTIAVESFVGEKSGVKGHYRVSVISFSTSPNVLVTMVQASTPEAWIKGKAALDEIVYSTRIVEQLGR